MNAWKVLASLTCCLTLGGCCLFGQCPKPASRGATPGTPPDADTPTTTPRAELVTAKGRYLVEETTELDDYETLEAPPVTGAPSKTLFRGTARKKAKLSISAAPVEEYDSVAELYVGAGSLPRDSEMTAKGISDDAASDRVEEERRNIAVMSWLYAAKKEEDNDYHIIIGTEPGETPRRFFNVELSGLPRSGQPFRNELKIARDKFELFFGSAAPSSSGYKKYNPPIPVIVTGSLFFDVSHAAGVVGPSGMKPASAWEIHPITDFEFEPAQN